jgi:hypothetical protein
MTRRVRRLKEPRPIEVETTSEGEPEAIRAGGEWRHVSLTRRPWRIDQLWWRGATVSRMYYRVAPEDGPAVTIFRDLVSGAWYRQEY